MSRSETRIDARSRPALMAWRRQRVAKLKADGLSRTEIAERMGLTYRQVRSAEPALARAWVCSAADMEKI